MCRLTPYSIPLSEVRSKETNGNIEESGLELSLEVTPSSSRPMGSADLNPCSCWKSAGLTYSSRLSSMDFISLSALSSSSTVPA